MGELGFFIFAQWFWFGDFERLEVLRGCRLFVLKCWWGVGDTDGEET